MTGEQLRDELARIAEGAPEVHVPADLYARGRRATLRHRVATAAAVAACLTLVAAVGTSWLSDDDAPVVDAGATPALPDHLHALPSHVAERDGEDDLAIGIGAAAFVAETGLPVVVDAEDGAYHLLDLDGFVLRTPPLGPGGHPVSLSPDGRLLAWAWAGDEDTSPRPTGVRIADLGTGDVREVRLDGTRAVLASELVWSRNSRWLAWKGTELRRWDSGGLAGVDRPIGGVIEAAADQEIAGHVVLAGRRYAEIERGGGLTSYGDASSAVAVSDEGVLAAVSGWTYYRDGRRTRLEEYPETRISGIWFDGEEVLAVEHAAEPPPADGDRTAAILPLPAGRRSLLVTRLLRPGLLGTVLPGQVVVYDDAPRDGGPEPAVELTARGSDPDPIIEVDEGVRCLSLASDLIDPADPTVTRPEPEWPWSTERWLWTVGGGIAGATALGLLVLVIVRARAVRR